MTGELTGQRSKHTTITPLNGQSHRKLPLNSYLCIHWLVMLTDLIREVFSAVDSGEHRNSDLITVQRMCLSVQPRLEHLHLSLNPPPKLRDDCGRRTKKIGRTWNHTTRMKRCLLDMTGRLQPWSHGSCGSLREAHRRLSWSALTWRKWGSEPPPSRSYWQLKAFREGRDRILNFFLTFYWFFFCAFHTMHPNPIHLPVP